MPTKKSAVTDHIENPKDVSKKASAPAETSRIRIRLKAFDHKIIDEATKIIAEIAQRTGALIRGPVPLPTDIKKYTVNRSTFVHKDSREQFEMRVHKGLIDIMSPTPKTIDGLTNLSLPSGVEVEIKM